MERELSEFVFTAEVKVKAENEEEAEKKIDKLMDDHDICWYPDEY